MISSIILFALSVRTIYKEEIYDSCLKFYIFWFQNSFQDVSIQAGSIVPTYLVILRSTVAVVAVFLNITFFFICFKKLRMKLHTLLILALHMSDVFLGIGSIWFTLSLLVPSMRINVRSYLFAISAMMFGMISKYSILFMISLERFLIIKSYNFGMRHTFDKFKIHLIIGIILFAFLGSVGPSFTPHTNTIDASSDPLNMYMKSYPIFVLVFMAILTLLSCLL